MRAVHEARGPTLSNSLLLEEVESFVRKERGLSARKVITTATTLEDDLSITGIEGETFMEAFFARFKVDEGDFSSGRYFMGEGSGLLLMLVTALSRNRRKALDRIPITVGMLVTAARLGKWDSAKVENGRFRPTLGKAIGDFGMGEQDGCGD